MAKKGKKRKSGRRKGGLTKAEIRAAGGDLKKAWAIKKHGGKKKRKASKTTTKTPRKAARRSSKRKKGQTAKQRAASKRNIKKAQAATRRKGGGGSKRKRSKSKSPRRAGRRSGGGRSGTRTVKTTIIKTGRNTREVAIVKVPVEHHRKPRKGKSKKRKGGGRKSKYMAENPLGAGELLLGGFTGILGFVVGDGTDRFLATHALAAGSTTGTYVDNPATSGGAQGYQGLYNATAVLAPMNLLRWGVGLGVPLVVVLGGGMIRNPMGRSGVQMFGFVWGVRTLAKGLTDLVAMMVNSTSFGQRLYDGELRAQMKQATNSGGTYSGPALPYSGLDVAAGGAGLGRALNAKPCGMGKATPCGNCAKGLPCAGQEQPPAPPPPGYAGAPRHIAPSAIAPAPAPAPMSNGSTTMGMYTPRYARGR